MERFLIGSPLVPAAKENALPFVGQGAHRGMMVESFDLALMVVKGSGPFTLLNRMGGVLMKGLTQELGTGPPEVNPLGGTAAHRNRRNPRVGLKLSDAAPAIPPRTKGRQQPRSQGRSSAGEGGENLRIRMSRKNLLASL